MKELRTKFVCIELNDSGTCKKVLPCVNLTDSEYNKLLNESLASKQHGLAKAQKQKEEIEKLDTRINKHDMLLAKSIFDNFVDRGLIEEDDELQQSFYDYIFNNKNDRVFHNEFFEKILDKIRGN